MYYSYHDIVIKEIYVNTVEFNDSKPPKPISTGYRYLYTEGRATQANYGKVAGYEDKKPYHVLAEGLAVESPHDEKRNFIPADIKCLDGNKYEFTERIHGNGRQGQMLYHLVLPKYCYVGEIVNNTTEDITIITRLNKQTLTARDSTVEEKFEQQIMFNGPDEIEFRKQPKESRLEHPLY
jgi:hypothetical protein